jgi:tetratricopeptide (TPR) repeat protein
MTTDPDGETHSTISGGIQYGPVLMGRDFRNVHIGDVVQAAPAPVALAQLPALAAGFTGRDTELAQITALLDPATAAGPVVVSAVAGLAGVGKTALAVQAAHTARQAGWFAGGVLFIDLHGYDDAPVHPGQALDSLLRALGVPAEYIPQGTEQRAGLYRSALAQICGSVLIIADNASAEAQVRPLLPGPGPHRMLVTSRHTLAGLGARLLDVATLDEQAAVAVMEEALQEARPGDDRIGADRPGAARLADICGGLPLALQITAALLKADPTRTVSDLAAELSDEVRRLAALSYDEGGGTSASSVAAAFDLSYRQLDETTARVFRLLSVNPAADSSTVAAAALADLAVGEVRRVMGQLLRAHLVETSAGAPDRWRMHDLLRLYAGQLSVAYAEADGQEQARDRLLDYFLDTAKAANDHLRALRGAPVPATFTDRGAALAWLDAERPSLIAAITMAASTGRDRVAVRLPLHLEPFFSWRRRLDDWLAATMTARDAAHRLGERDFEAAALNSLGSALSQVGRVEEAIAVDQEAVEIFREIGDRRYEAGALNTLGDALSQVGRVEEAIAVDQEAVEIFREIGDRRYEGTALGNLGNALGEVGRLEEAIFLHQASVEISRETNDWYREGGALTNLGNALTQAGRAEEAITAHQEAVAILREIGDRYRESGALTNLGLALHEAGRVDEAITMHQDAALISRETSDRHREGPTLYNLGNALRDTGRVEDAITAYQEAIVILRETGDRHNQGQALNNLGVAFREIGRAEEAITAYRDAAVIFREAGDLNNEIRALSNLGVALNEVGRAEEAITTYQDAMTILREPGGQHGEGQTRNQLGNALYNLGIALAEVGRVEESITVYQEAAAIYRETDDQHSEGDALNNLGIALAKAGRAEESIAVHQKAAVVFRELGDQRSEGNALRNLKLTRMRNRFTAWYSRKNRGET